MLVSDQAPASPGWAPCPNPLLAHECRFAGMNQTFEEKEARRSGVKTSMTKPFQSLRQLMNRMLGVNSNGKDATAYEYTTLGIGSSDSEPSAAEISAADIDVQTADTQRLPQVNPEFMSGQDGNAEPDDEFGDSLLDLDGVHGSQAFTNDPVLDLDFETAPHVGGDFLGAPSASSTEVFDNVSLKDVAVSEPKAALDNAKNESDEAIQPRAVNEEVSAASLGYHSDMSSAAIEAIAQRVVEHLSDKVVREIAWEVVPELSELLIKQQLGQRQ